MNQAEKRAGEQFRKEKRDEIEAEQYWKKNFKMYERMDVIEGFEYLNGQGLGSGVFIKVKCRLMDLNKSLGRNGNIY